MSIFIIRQTTTLFCENTSVIGYLSSQYESESFVEKKKDCLERMESKLLDFHTNSLMDWKESNEILKAVDSRKYNSELSSFVKQQINEILSEDEYEMHLSLVDYDIENRYWSSSWSWEEIQSLE